MPIGHLRSPSFYFLFCFLHPLLCFLHLSLCCRYQLTKASSDHFRRPSYLYFDRFWPSPFNPRSPCAIPLYFSLVYPPLVHLHLHPPYPSRCPNKNLRLRLFKMMIDNVPLYPWGQPKEGCLLNLHRFCHLLSLEHVLQLFS